MYPPKQQTEEERATSHRTFFNVLLGVAWIGLGLFTLVTMRRASSAWIWISMGCGCFVEEVLVRREIPRRTRITVRILLLGVGGALAWLCAR